MAETSEWWFSPDVKYVKGIGELNASDVSEMRPQYRICACRPHYKLERRGAIVSGHGLRLEKYSHVKLYSPTSCANKIDVVTRSHDSTLGAPVFGQMINPAYVT